MTPASASTSGRLSHSIVTSRSPGVERTLGCGGAGACTYQWNVVSLPSNPVQASQSKSDHTHGCPGRYSTSIATPGGSGVGNGWYAGSRTNFSGQWGS